MTNISNKERLTLASLAAKDCGILSSTSVSLSLEQIDGLLTVLPEWRYDPEPSICRQYKFKNYQQTVQHVNAIASIAESNDHHPEVSFSYNICSIRYSTHVNNGITENDFICAAQIELAFLQVDD